MTSRRKISEDSSDSPAAHAVGLFLCYTLEVSVLRGGRPEIHEANPQFFKIASEHYLYQHSTRTVAALQSCADAHESMSSGQITTARYQ